jgi:hypothetical protein
MSYDGHSFLTSFFATRTATGCMHSNRLPGSKYVHCLHECNSNAHFGHFPSAVIPCNTVPHCEHRETSRVPAIFTGRGPNVVSRFEGGACFSAPRILRDKSRDRFSRSLSPGSRSFRSPPESRS